MKKLARLLMAASICCVAACDTDVPTNEVTDILTYRTRCGMSGGIPLTSTQAQAVGALVNKQSLNGLSVASISKNQLSDVIFGTQNIISLYKAVYQYVDANPKNDNDWYCACGTEVCDFGVGCQTNDGVSSCTALKVDEGSCGSIEIDQRMFAYILAVHLFPVLVQVSKLHHMDMNNETEKATLLKLAHLKEDAGSSTGESNGSKKTVSDGSSAGLDKLLPAKTGETATEVETWINARLFYSSIVECINEKTAACPENWEMYIEGARLSSGSSESFYELVYNIIEDLISDTQEYKDAKDEEKSGYVRQFAIDQVKGLSASSTVNLAKMATDPNVKYLATELFDLSEMKDTNSFDASKVKYLKKHTLMPSNITNDIAKSVTEVLKNILVAGYEDSKNMNFKSSDYSKIYKAHRTFFARFVLSSMSVSDKANLFKYTFRRNETCEDKVSATGQTYGLNKYCKSPIFENGMITFNDLASTVLESNNSLAIVSDLADGIIMDTNFTLDHEFEISGQKLLSNMSVLEGLYDQISTQYGEELMIKLGLSEKSLSKLSAIKISEITIYLGDKANTETTAKIALDIDDKLVELPTTVKFEGTWNTYRCPMGASCTVNNECGICSNSEVKHNYGGEYTDAFCRSGVLVNETGDSHAPQDPGQTGQ